MNDDHKPIPEKILERYIRVRKLALHGIDGEKDNALRMLTKMQGQYPDIEEEASFWERINSDDFEDSDEESSSEEVHWSDVWKQQQKERQTGQWKSRFDQFTQTATNAFSWAANMASHAFGVQDARNLALEQSFTNISIRKNPSGSQTMNVRVSEETLAYIQTLNDEQKATYCNVVAQRVAMELYQTIT